MKLESPDITLTDNYVIEAIAKEGGFYATMVDQTNAHPVRTGKGKMAFQEIKNPVATGVVILFQGFTKPDDNGWLMYIWDGRKHSQEAIKAAIKGVRDELIFSAINPSSG